MRSGRCLQTPERQEFLSATACGTWLSGARRGCLRMAMQKVSLCLRVSCWGESWRNCCPTGTWCGGFHVTNPGSSRRCRGLVSERSSGDAGRWSLPVSTAPRNQPRAGRFVPDFTDAVSSGFSVKGSRESRPCGLQPNAQVTEFPPSSPRCRSAMVCVGVPPTGDSTAQEPRYRKRSRSCSNIATISSAMTRMEASFRSRLRVSR